MDKTAEGHGSCGGIWCRLRQSEQIPCRLACLPFRQQPYRRATNIGIGVVQSGPEHRQGLIAS
jgi:hypothetical protein